MVLGVPLGKRHNLPIAIGPEPPSFRPLLHGFASEVAPERRYGSAPFVFMVVVFFESGLMNVFMGVHGLVVRVLVFMLYMFVIMVVVRVGVARVAMVVLVRMDAVVTILAFVHERQSPSRWHLVTPSAAAEPSGLVHRFRVALSFRAEEPLRCVALVLETFRRGAAS